MRLFRKKPKCPTCGKRLQTKPKRKQKCPHCGSLILVRAGQLVTEDEARTSDWLARLEPFGVSRRDFEKEQVKLTKQFGEPAGVNDTVWRILNSFVMKFAEDPGTLERVYRQMASLVAKEGKDPTPYLLEAEKARRKRAGHQARSDKQVFLAHDELAYVRGLRNEGKLDQAEELLMKAEPSPAVLDELRKTASARARKAKKEGNWRAVVQHLERYSSYAEECREHCIDTVNQEPPAHTKRDKRLLQEAKTKLAD